MGFHFQPIVIQLEGDLLRGLRLAALVGATMVILNVAFLPSRELGPRFTEPQSTRALTGSGLSPLPHHTGTERNNSVRLLLEAFL